jgi:acyl carrier protein
VDRRQFVVFGYAAIARLLDQESCEPRKEGKKQTTYRQAEIATRVKQIIVEQLGVEPAKVTDTARFIEDLGADSLDVVELTMAFEEAFDIEISEEESAQFKTVGDAVKHVTADLRSAKRVTDENSSMKPGTVDSAMTRYASSQAPPLPL